ncbi:PilZ domain-containing protein [Rhodanobacter denitrificans]
MVIAWITAEQPGQARRSAPPAKGATERFQGDVGRSPLDGCKYKQAVELMAIDKNGQDGGGPEQLRPARMQIETTVLMSSNGESRPTELVDISATGALLRRPLGWSGHVGQNWVLDMIFGNNLHIHLEAVVARISDHHIGFSYSRIPEDKQVPLWNLLGGYADILEYWKDG